YRGDFAAARAHLERGMALYDPRQHGGLAFHYGYDPGQALLGWGAWALHFLGYPDQALESCRRAVALARGQAHPYNLACALTQAACVNLFRRDMPAARERAEEVVPLATGPGLPSPVPA